MEHSINFGVIYMGSVLVILVFLIFARMKVKMMLDSGQVELSAIFFCVFCPLINTFIAAYIVWLLCFDRENM